MLGEYDFVTIVEAATNEAVARFSIELGVKAGMHITTLPCVPVSRPDVSNGEGLPDLETDVRLNPEVVWEQETGPGSTSTLATD